MTLRLPEGIDDLFNNETLVLLEGRYFRVFRDYWDTTAKLTAFTERARELKYENDTSAEHQRAITGKHVATVDRHEQWLYERLARETKQELLLHALVLRGIHALQDSGEHRPDMPSEAVECPESDEEAELALVDLHEVYEPLGAFQHIAAVIGNGPCKANTCEGCRYEMEEVRDLARTMVRRLTPTQDELDEREMRRVALDEGIYL